tara:strand:+ start:1070 stop:1954 length:885 start_codon:yes stop_codon:yes gene_type:complete
MITFTQLGQLGRLGNQLFQYAALKSIGLKRGYEIKIPNPAEIHWQGQDCLLNHFNLECEFLEPADLPKIHGSFMEPTVNRFYPVVFNISDNTDLYGFFQNYRYFKDIETQIKKEFELSKEITDEASQFFQLIVDSQNSDDEIVSVHIRRGDNTDGTNPEYSNFYGENDVLTKESHFGQYFYKALEQFADKKVKYLVFSGGSRKGDNSNLTDIEWCKKNFNGDNIYYSEGNSDLVDFSIMSMCHHNITCHMTSFGWWAALLNKNPNKRVIAPRSYTVPDDMRYHSRFYPETWEII